MPIKEDMKKVFDINNGITLCRKCHLKTFGKEMELSVKYLEKLNIA